jgi:hypothetical protein
MLAKTGAQCGEIVGFVPVNVQAGFEFARMFELNARTTT